MRWANVAVARKLPCLKNNGSRGDWHKKNFRPHLGEYFFLSRPSWPRFTPPRKSEVATQHTHDLVFTQSLVDTNGTTNTKFPVNEKCFPVNEKRFPINETIWLFMGSTKALLEIFCLVNFYFLGSGPLDLVNMGSNIFLMSDSPKWVREWTFCVM